MPHSPMADLACMLLSNLSLVPSVSNLLLNTSTGSTSLRLDHLLSVFVRGVDGSYNSNANFHFLANVFANLTSTSARGRNLMLEDNFGRKGNQVQDYSKENDLVELESSVSVSFPSPPILSNSSSSTTLHEETLNEAISPTESPESIPLEIRLGKLLCFTNHPNLHRRGGVISTIK